MVISRTPFRISFFGGGTDYPSWYLKHGGAVLATSINKYCYLTCRYLPPFFEHRLRVVYSKIESVQNFEDIVHPSVRETLRFLAFKRGLEIHHDGDLPARSGMGSSSSFTVGLLHALYALQGVMPDKKRLAHESICIEQEMIGETVGSQDQTSAAFGGLNQIIFHKSGDITVKPVTIRRERREALQCHMMLFYTGLMRTASDVASTYVNDLTAKEKRLSSMRTLVDDAVHLLSNGNDIREFGEMLHQTWLLKRGLASAVSNPVVDDLYERARKRGAIGGKLAGAGGGGFLMLFAPPDKQEKIQRELKELIHVPFKFENSGSQIIFFDPNAEDFSVLDRQRRRNSKQFKPFCESSCLK